MDIAETLKDHERAILELLADVAGLKATLTGADRDRFDQARRVFLEHEPPSDDTSA